MINPKAGYKIKRAELRIIKRKLNYNNSLRVRLERKLNKRCDSCGGSMYWCSSCEMWSRNCCEDYGTCLCS